VFCLVIMERFFFYLYSYFGLLMYAMACRGCRFSAVNILPWMREMSLCAKSRFVVKLRLASSRLLTNRRGTGPSRLSHLNISVVRGHSSRRHVATVSLNRENYALLCFSNSDGYCLLMYNARMFSNLFVTACLCMCFVFSNSSGYCLLMHNARMFSNFDGYCLLVFSNFDGYCLLSRMHV